MAIYEQFGTVVHVKTTSAILVFASGVAAFAFLWIWIFKLLARKSSGWNRILTRFPMLEIHPLGKKYKGQSGDIGRVDYDRGFTLCFVREGICVYPFFARRAPCLIPWESIRSVEVSDACIFVVVEHERRMQFALPHNALQEIRSYVTPESVRHAISVFEAMKVATGSGARLHWLWGKRE